MSPLRSGIYEGVVVHKRLSPRQHGFSYRVFTLCLDVDELDTLGRTLRLFSYNRKNILSLRDSDLGAPVGGTVGEKARRLLRDVGLQQCMSRIELVCYPRLFGYAFNPLAVYFCRDATDAVGAMIYEVTNTVGERKSYVIPADAKQGVLAQRCDKALYVSPFTAPNGTYGFHTFRNEERLVVGVNFRELGRPVLKTHFTGSYRPLTDSTIARMTLKHPLMTFKVISMIHVQAAKLWAKGVPVAERRSSPAYSYKLVDPANEGARHG
jgi:DUF1365 family protein